MSRVMPMKENEQRKPASLRVRLLTTVLLCWVLPVLLMMGIANYLLASNFERSMRQQMQISAENAMEKLDLRLENLFTSSKSISYDGEVRSAYRSYEQDGDSAALYQRVMDYLTLHFTRTDAIPATFLSFRELPSLHPYVTNRSNYGYAVQRDYRDAVEAELLERMAEEDTRIVFTAHNGELYLARNLLNSKFEPYAMAVLLCDREQLFQSLDALRPLSDATLVIDESLVLRPDGSLQTLEAGESVAAGDLQYAFERDGHTIRLSVALHRFSLWTDTPQLRFWMLAVQLLALPLLLVVLLVFHHSVTKPMETLSEANARLQGGERGFQITEKASSKEFAALYEQYNETSRVLKNQFERSYQEQQALQEAKMKALQSQINPHFLNNTLEVINWEARLAGNERVSAMIEALSTMMDATLNRDGRSMIPLREELVYTDAYLLIIRERLGDRLEVRREIDESLLELPVPRLILQPIAENAVEYDITPNRGGVLLLRARREGENMLLEVEHSGRMSKEDEKTIRELLSSPAERSGHFGLRNVVQRLRLLYGERASLQIVQKDESTVLARACFPL